MIELQKDKINHRKETFGGLVINIETGKLYKLNKTGYEIFLALNNDVSVEKLVKKLEKKFEINQKKINIELNRFFQKLIKNGLALKKR